MTESDLPDAKDLYPLDHADRDSLYRCKLCGAITRYQDRLLHSRFHKQVVRYLRQHA